MMASIGDSIISGKSTVVSVKRSILLKDLLALLKDFQSSGLIEVNNKMTA